MRSRIPLFALLLLAGSLALPLAAHAAIPFFGPILPDPINRCAAGWTALIIVFNNLISLFITLAIVFVAPLMVAWAGFLFVVNPVNASGKEQAKKILTNTVVGIVIALAGYMIVSALMAVLYNANAPVGTSGGVLGTWSSLIGSGGLDSCIPLVGSLNQTPAGQGITGVSATGVTTTGGNVLVNISSAASAYRGASTSAGPNGGARACAWAVNNVLRNAGISPIDGDSVQAMENTLQGGRGTLIDQSVAQPGDIVIEAGDGHVGICLNAGCSQVISNSSSRASFSWTSGPDFLPSYRNGVGRVYRVKN